LDVKSSPAADRLTPSATDIDALATVNSVARATLGTRIELNAPLMSAGLDSLAAAAFVSTLATRLSVDVAPTELFDHPTLASIASFISTQVEVDDVPAVKCLSCTEAPERAQLPRNTTTVLSAWSLQLAGSLSSDADMRQLTARMLVANSTVPAT